MKVVWAPLAERRAEEALATIAAEKPLAAERWLGRLLAGVESLESFPQRGRMVPETARPEIREILVAPYRVLYRCEPKRIVILTIRHERRAFDARETR